MKPFLLVAITGDEGVPPALARLLFDHGLDFLYWRSPVSTSGLLSLPSEYHPRVLVTHDPAAPFQLHRKESKNDIRHSFSTSIHQLSDWSRSAAEMVFFSPVFPSISKPGYGPVVSLPETAAEMVRIRQEAAGLPRLIALGGVTATRIGVLIAAGFDGAAVMGTLWNAPDPVAALAELRQAVAENGR